MQDEAFSPIADQLTEFDHSSDAHVVQPESYTESIVPIYLHTIASAAAYQFRTEELIVSARMCKTNIIISLRSRGRYVVQDYYLHDGDNEVAIVTLDQPTVGEVRTHFERLCRIDLLQSASASSDANISTPAATDTVSDSIRKSLCELLAAKAQAVTEENCA